MNSIVSESPICSNLYQYGSNYGIDCETKLLYDNYYNYPLGSYGLVYGIDPYINIKRNKLKLLLK